MKKNKGILVKKSFLIIFLIVQLILISTNQYPSEMTMLGHHVKSYTIIDIIKIESDDDFVTYGFPGNGSEENPYRIENYNVQSPYFFGIEIKYTTKYFVIQNCIITAAIHSCIQIDHAAASTAKIVNNIITGDITGLVIYASSNTIIANNTFQNNDLGIWIEGSENSVIADNTFSVYGIRVDMYDYWSLSECLSYDIYNNTVNDKPIGWFKNEVDLIFNDSTFEQLYFVNCSNLSITNQESSSNVEGFVGIGLYRCQNANVAENKCGIDVVNGDKVRVQNNRFTNTFLSINSATDVKIENNRYNDGYFKMYLSGLNSVKIINNTCGFNQYPSALNLYQCYFCNIEDNHIASSKEYGISLYSCGSLTIKNNEISDNEKYGIRFRETDNCKIYQNIFARNKDYGVSIEDSSVNNMFWSNIFTKNSVSGASQASDNVATNYWYNTSTNVGNYWDDLGDLNTYSIDGSAGSFDLYPLSDTDYDGMPAEWEIAYDLDPWFDDSNDDIDDDDLTNLEEYFNNSNPWMNDTDSDGLLDGEEVNVYFTKPNKADSDSDGLSDWDEIMIYFTDANNPDSDGDGVLDGEEIENGYDPLDPNDPKKASIPFFVVLLTISILTLITTRKKREKSIL